MAAREERLTPATRNYVIFGLLFVVAVALAVHDWVNPQKTRGLADSPLRVLIVSDHEHGPRPHLEDVDGFNATRIDARDAVWLGSNLLADPEAPSYTAAIAYADEFGFGFVALDLRNPSSDAVPYPYLDWQLPEEVPESARFAVFGVGDVAPEGPRMHAAALPESDSVVFERDLAELDALRLSLYEHPDLRRLWEIEPEQTELQARQVLAARGLDDRRALIQRDHRRWATLPDAWPAAATVPGTLAGPWERVLAAPISGGLLLEVRSARARVSSYRKLGLELDEAGTLAFLPASALAGDGAPSQARRPCEGLPERVTGEIAVAPDGAAVIIREPGQRAELFVFDAAEPDRCRARKVADFDLGERAVGRASTTAMAWAYDDDWLRWWDAGGEHELRVAGIGASSGPWWVAERVLAQIAERSTVAGPSDDPSRDWEPVLVLLATEAVADTNERPRVELGTRELFGELLVDAPLLDLRPAKDGLLFSTERCPNASADDPLPCLHRLRPAAPFATVVAELAAGTRTIADALTVETLGPIAPHVELAVAADGSRVAWIDRADHQLWVADLRGPSRLAPRRLDADTLAEHSLRISADGRVIVSEIELELEGPAAQLGKLTIPRAFVLEPAPPEPPEPTEPESALERGLERQDPVDVP